MTPPAARREGKLKPRDHRHTPINTDENNTTAPFASVIKPPFPIPLSAVTSPNVRVPRNKTKTPDPRPQTLNPRP